MASGQKILIIDDDARNIFALTAVLRSKGFTCITATEVGEALHMLEKQHDINAVLLDMMMPDIDGYEAIPRIKQLETSAELPVIAVTAQAMNGDRERCLAAGADGYVSKPVDIDLLVNLMNELIKKN
ncbi:response regulator [Filimonas effusa]|uniref:Response regulator n=1 Tax=Filimonas effusa TaxID=2508721 RepID=A0A4Q1DAA7_9BACT|nr:response regulator [Filimonas effusa]RXK86332.1 response regulator [Filimonas effusa]